MKQHIFDPNTDYQKSLSSATTTSTSDLPLALSIGEAAKLSGVSRSTLYAEMMAGRLAWAKVGKRRLIPTEALLAWLRSATTH